MSAKSKFSVWAGIKTVLVMVAFMALLPLGFAMLSDFGRDVVGIGCLLLAFALAFFMGGWGEAVNTNAERKEKEKEPQ